MSDQSQLLEAARGGDEDAFARLVEPHRSALQAHCYRMLGSRVDAEDAVQETMLAAWRGLARFEGRSSLRSWLYTIATNASLRAIERRPKRVLPIDYGPPADPHDKPREPLVESVWIEPFPDAEIAAESASPEGRYEERESVELAFIAALQHLPARQRGILILRDVLGFSARETAEALDDGELKQVVEGYVAAWERADVEAMVEMLAEDAVLAMPPEPHWFAGREAPAAFLARFPFGPAVLWRLLPTTANGQLAFGHYLWHEDGGAFVRRELSVISLRGSEIVEITVFRTPEAFAGLDLPQQLPG